ncbi:hypothetical protein EDD16DRAFT_1555044 [Pisolithus croceorrhizus]|nr:hypothetical protein EDD16DRAFT_1555044 [Pisolithus croceorrhizus]
MTGTNSFTNSDAAECYGLPASEMVTWIKDFSNTYEAATSRYPGEIALFLEGWSCLCFTSVIYTTTSCASFADDNPLWIGRLGFRLSGLSLPDTLDSGTNPGDADLWNGWLLALNEYATFV